MEISDNQLVRQILAGDTELYATLVKRYQSQVYNLMYRTSGSADEAADMSQEVFCRAFAKLKTYRKRSSFFSWLYTLAMNYARDWKKKRYNRSVKLGRYATEMQTDERAVAGQEYERREAGQQLQQALEAIDPEKREMLVLRYTHDCSIKELAEIFGLTESAVKMRLKRSLAELQKGMPDG